MEPSNSKDSQRSRNHACSPAPGEPEGFGRPHDEAKYPIPKEGTMTGFNPRTNRARIGLALALASISVLATSATAAAGQRSWIGAYQVQQFVAVDQGFSEQVTIACGTDDTLVRATHRIDAVDAGGSYKDVSGSATYGGGNGVWLTKAGYANRHTATYTVTFADDLAEDPYPSDDEFAGGDGDVRAQVHVFATCVPDKTNRGEVFEFQRNTFALAFSGVKYSKPFNGVAHPRYSVLEDAGNEDAYRIQSYQEGSPVKTYGRRFIGKTVTHTSAAYDTGNGEGGAGYAWKLNHGAVREIVVRCEGSYQAMSATYNNVWGLDGNGFDLIGSEPRGNGWAFRVKSNFPGTGTTTANLATDLAPEVLCLGKQTLKKRQLL